MDTFQEVRNDVRTLAVSLGTPKTMKATKTFVATNKRLSSFEKEMQEWRKEMEEWRNEKAAFLDAYERKNRYWQEEKEVLNKRIAHLENGEIKHMKGKMEALELEILALKRELAEAKANNKLEEGEIQPSMMEELNTIKVQVQAMSEEEKQNKAKTSSWVDVITTTQKKMEEAEKWIEVAKKGKNTPTPTIINMTLEEEQRRRTRALHVRVTGLRDRDNVNEEVKELMLKMGIDTPTHTRAWRVGKKGNGEASTSKERALILRFPSIEEKKEFLKKRPTLKKTGIFLGDDLTLAQVAHMQEVMPEIKAAREKGKVAFYRDGRVVILERGST